MIIQTLLSSFLAFSQQAPLVAPAVKGVLSETTPVVSVAPPSALLSDIIEKFIYDPRGKNDPFKPYVIVRPVQISRVMEGPILPLQRYSLDQLKLVGVIWGGKKPMAMLIDGSKKVYYVRESDKIGNNQGYVAKIREGEIVVVEVLYDDEGKASYITRVMKIQKQK